MPRTKLRMHRVRSSRRGEIHRRTSNGFMRPAYPVRLVLVAHPEDVAVIAMQLSRTGHIEGEPLHRIELPSPVPRAGELVLRVAACAVCRTDLQLCEGDLTPRRLPI